ncbi:MAG: PLP-dependent aminotransferase family protein [Aminobacterium sp.]|uniref:aminotransferase-like domain-containing protein n=1 Tax=Aminobacterium sp. TaxID=1872491 RepID=UPI001BD083D0|nr:aminotransferase class I/II-fold pyridoxal phosphate-dependent enzyme [Aminobacterium sp.]MDD2206358.1 PLP-dependent aminotransferase family protein [Aminobacterium sp.]MDD3426170.1 PLP-dependent aminotransferase family protein [Aminobacterium sp.]MDD3707495.1 PLP-dependent aminotransferase family protein [Aminobacterium sp.]MDD4228375.1 PLP-dependent aminotransferase family protein [Aminobacterium sp.]MDD4552271.1 PLP-dependent aminotransferase family protein [Aminobacterium sp.]
MNKCVFAERMKNFQASDIAAILKVTADPEIISFAGGLPAPELFPIEELKEVVAQVLEKDGTKALQYSTTEGYAPLREKIASRMNRKYQTRLESGNIMITTGSQQSLDLLGKMLIDDGDVVLCESPTYLGALSAFNGYNPRYVEVETDDYGMVPEALEEALTREKRAKAIYVIPDFQNPTGKTWTVERRKAFMDVISRYDIVVIEDNPYGELRFKGEVPPSLKSFDKEGKVVLLGTFSKIFCPGMRIAWLCADGDIYEKFAYLKQAADLHSPTLSQYEINAYIDMYDLDAHVARLIDVYKKRCNVMIETMKVEFPSSVSFTIPEGGLFTWAILPETLSARDLLMTCLEKKVAFVPGGAFFPNGGHENTLRLNYSNMPPERIIRGIQLLGEAIKEHLR